MTTTLPETFLFDPGYAKHTTILSISAEYIYADINRFKNFNQKKMKFKMSYPQITKMVNGNVGFCLGSLIWAAYIKSFENVEIKGNPCLGTTYNKTEAVEEADYSIEFFNRLKKDVKYYLGQDYQINPFHIKILELYKEFLILNCGFVNTRTTSDIVLPQSLKIPAKKDAEKINQKIREVIKTGNLLDLTDVFNLVYKG